MKILLLSPCQDPAHKTPGPLRIPQIALQVLAGLTDRRHDVRIVEEEFEEIDRSLEADLVGLSLMTANSTRGYELADHFRRRGATVVLGGIHPTILPEEALRHADAVVVGEAEEVWPELLADVERGALKRTYEGVGVPKLSGLPFPRRSLGPHRRFRGILPVMTTRGCPFACEFCSTSRVYGRKVRTYDVDWVVEDIRRSGGKRFLFLDDNVIAAPAFARELFAALKPLDIRWVGQASMTFAMREDLMRLAYESGCRALFFGMETVSEASMERMKKCFRDLDDVAAAVGRIQAAGVAFHASVVFGFDSDDTDIFDATVDFLLKCRVFSTTLNVLTPYPGTEVFDRYRAEGRLFSEAWEHYDHSTVVFRPAGMSPRELAEGQRHARRRFYGLGSIARRFPCHRKVPIFYSGLNLAMRSAARRARLPLAPGGEGLGRFVAPVAAASD
ncbi:MAG: radical SAM protein [Planctomycetota bacterium]